MLVVSTILVVLIVAYWMLKSPPDRKRNPKKVQRANQRPTHYHPHPYHAVSIRHDDCVCPTVRALGTRRFLANKVPNFPLPSCDAPRCNCRYMHHEDRREQDNRRAVYSMKSDLYVLSGNNERRASKARRQSDNVTDLASEFDFKDIKQSA
jgi:hypothetical protein